MILSPKQKKALGRGAAKRHFLSALSQLENLIFIQNKPITLIITNKERSEIAKAVAILSKVEERWDQTSLQLRKEYMKEQENG